MGEEFNLPTNRAELEQFLARIVKVVRNLRRSREKEEEVLDGMVLWLEEVMKNFVQAGPGGPPAVIELEAPHQLRWKELPPEVRKHLERMAERGIEHIEVRRRPSDDWLEVSIDHDEFFDVSPILGDVLIVLAADERGSGESLVPWKSIGQIAESLAQRWKRPFGLHAVDANISRLRAAFWDRGGVNPYYVQRSRRKWARLSVTGIQSRAMREGAGPALMTAGN